MLDEKIIEEIEQTNSKINNATSSLRGEVTEDRLSAVKKLVLQANRDAESRVSEREQSIKETELEKEKRLAQTKAKIAENAARAEKLASERTARMEYSGEYRQRLMARENKKAAEEKKRRQEAEIEASRIRDEERAREIEEFIRNEKEAAMRRAAVSGELFSCVQNATPKEPSPQKEQTLSDSAEEKITEPELSDKALNAADESLKEESDGKIFLEITPSGSVRNNGATDENVIHISGVQYHAQRPHAYSYAMPQSQQLELDAELARANERHAALKLAAVAKAAGVYQDEIRLLEEEELRYNLEISEIQEKISEYAERREYMSASAESFALGADGITDESTKQFDEFSDSLITGERLNAEDELLLYEKYREESDLQGERPQPSMAENDNGIPMEYGYFEPTIPPPSEYAEPYTQYSYPENVYGKSEEALKSYEESLEAKRLSEKNDGEQMPGGEKLSYSFNDAGSFAKAALLKKLSEYRRAESILAKKIKKLSAKQNAVSGEEKTLIIVEKIGIRKEITELAVEALTACVYANAKFKTVTYKRVLVSQINAYNAACDEYEMHTGRPLVHLSSDMASEVAAGRICDPIPNVYYYGSEAFGVRDGVGVSIDEERSNRLAEEALLEEAEFHRLLSENYTRDFTPNELRERDKRQAEKMSAIKRATERDLLLIGLRQDYRLAQLESEYDMLLHSFSTDKKKKDKRLSALERRISKMRTELKRAVKLARGDNSRYYLLSAMDSESEKIKKSASRERLYALKMRLDVLLSEREEINERLIALYGGTDKKLTKTKINRKAGGVRKKHAKATYRKQRSIANRIDRIKAPLDMKEKAYALLNKKTACVATIEECYYKLRRLKPEGRAKKELLSNIRRAKAAMRTVDADVNFLIKKMKRHERRLEDERSWAKFLVVLFLLIVAGAVLWYFYADDVLAYFTDLFGKLGIK